MKRLVLPLLVAFAACRTTPEPPTPSAVGSASTALPPASSPPLAAGPQATLDRLDPRVPVPLLPMMANHQKQNMRDHLAAVQEIVAGLGANDFDAIEKASKRIGYSEQMGQMCAHMGAGAPGFTEQALAFHHQADEIGVAAKKRDSAAVLAALAATMTTCTGCHATYKQQVVDDATFATASPAGSHAGMHPPAP